MNTLPPPTKRGNPIASIALQATGAPNEWAPRTVEEKASYYAELRQWTSIDHAPYSLLVQSATEPEKRQYRVDFDPKNGRVRCNCMAGSRKKCWHKLAFVNTMLADLHENEKKRKAEVARLTAEIAASTNPAPTDARSRGDFDVDCELAATVAPRLSHPNPVGLGACGMNGGRN